MTRPAGLARSGRAARPVAAGVRRLRVPPRQVAICLAGDAPPLSLTLPVGGTVDLRAAPRPGSPSRTARCRATSPPCRGRSSWTTRPSSGRCSRSCVLVGPRRLAAVRSRVDRPAAGEPRDPHHRRPRRLPVRPAAGRRSGRPSCGASSSARLAASSWSPTTPPSRSPRRRPTPPTPRSCSCCSASRACWWRPPSGWPRLGAGRGPPPRGRAAAAAWRHRRPDRPARRRAGRCRRRRRRRARPGGRRRRGQRGRLGRPVWRGVPARRLVAVAAARARRRRADHGGPPLRLRRAGRRSRGGPTGACSSRGWSPAWRGARLDLVAIGGRTGHPGRQRARRRAAARPHRRDRRWRWRSTCCWPRSRSGSACTLLVVRGLAAARLWPVAPGPSAHRPLPSWRGAALRWLGRRPARTGGGARARGARHGVRYAGADLRATIQTAKAADAQAAIGSDLRARRRVTQASRCPPRPRGSSRVSRLPQRPGPGRQRPQDDPGRRRASYASTVTAAPQLLAGQGFEALARDPKGVLVAAEIADGFARGPRRHAAAHDLPRRRRHRAGRWTCTWSASTAPSRRPCRSPSWSMTTAALPPAVVVPPDFYLARVGPGSAPGRSQTPCGRVRSPRSTRCEQAGSSTARRPHRAQPRRARPHRVGRRRADRRRRGRGAGRLPRAGAPAGVRHPACRGGRHRQRAERAGAGGRDRRRSAAWSSACPSASGWPCSPCASSGCSSPSHHRS